MATIPPVSSTEPLPLISTEPTDAPVQKHVILTVSDMAIAGDLLGVIVGISIIMNMYTFYVVTKNWKNFVQFPFSQSNIICMFLSLADLALALFLGVPTALHLKFAHYFSEQYPKTMVFYSTHVGFFLLDYMFLLRMLIIAVISIDRCVHIMRPLVYKFYVTHRVTVCIIVTLAVVPFVMRVIPNIIYLNMKAQSSILCEYFRNPDANETTGDYAKTYVNFTVPLTCMISIYTKGENTMDMENKVQNSLVTHLATFDIGLLMTGVLLTCAAIIVSNLVILVIIVTRFKARRAMTRDDNIQKKKVHQSVQKNLIATMIMAFVFMITNGPFLGVWFFDYMSSFKQLTLVDIQTNSKRKLYMLSTVFLSLLVNPWLYLLRMETIRRFFPCFQTSFTQTIRRTLHNTKSQVFSTLSRNHRSPTPDRPLSQSSRISNLTNIGPGSPAPTVYKTTKHFNFASPAQSPCVSPSPSAIMIRNRLSSPTEVTFFGDNENKEEEEAGSRSNQYSSIVIANYKEEFHV